MWLACHLHTCAPSETFFAPEPGDLWTRSQQCFLPCWLSPGFLTDYSTLGGEILFRGARCSFPPPSPGQVQVKPKSSPSQVQVKSKSSLWRIQFVFKSWTVVAQKLILVSDILFNRTPLPGSIIWLVEVQFQSSKSKILHNFSEHTSQSLYLILDLDYKLLFNHFISNKLLNINMK